MPRRETSLQRRITAWHEAAHAVVAFRFGIRVDEVAICQTGPLAGYVHMLGTPLVSRRETWDSRASRLTWAMVRRDTERHAMLRLAGPVAEAKLFGTPMRSHGCESDHTSAMRLCTLLDQFRKQLAATRALVVPGESPGDLAARLRRRTRHALAYPRTWRAVKALAEDLDVWSRLTGCDAADTVQWTQRIEGQLSLLLPVPVQPGTGTRRHSPRIGYRPLARDLEPGPGIPQQVNVP
jgi:hypothetical protein